MPSSIDPAVLAGFVALFVAIGGAFLAVNLLVGWLVRPRMPNTEKLEVYECGEPTIGSSFVQFDLRFYVVALLFIIFDLEVAFLFPWAVAFRDVGAFGFWSMMAFLGVLTVGFVYEWCKGALDWE